MARSEFSTACLDFTQNTTFHGVKYIFEPTPYRVRRIFWTSVVCLGIGLFIFQVQNRFRHFLSDPISVNIEVNHNQTMFFPAITICNQNSFRRSVMNKNNLTSLIELYYSNIPPEMIMENLTEHANLTMRELMDLGSHTIDDMLVDCKWAGTDCFSSNFTRRWTDHGVCYTFNSAVDQFEKILYNDSELLSATDAGTHQGLEIVLNIQQYEYMAGPQKAAGLKILIHEPDDFPLVDDFGHAVMPSSYTLIGVKRTEMFNVSTDEESLSYSQIKCRKKCYMEYVVAKCGCKEVYFEPDFEFREKEYPYCNLLDTIDCLKTAKLDFTLEKPCATICYPDAHKVIFDPNMSYTVQANISIERFLQSDKLTDIHQQFVNSSQQADRSDPEKNKMDVELFAELANSSHACIVKIDQSFHLLHKFGAFIDRIEEQTNHLFLEEKAAIEVLLKSYDINYHQVYELKKTEIFASLTSRYQEFIHWLSLLQDDMINASEDHKEVLHTMVMQALKLKDYMAKISLESFKEFQKSFETLQPLSKGYGRDYWPELPAELLHDKSDWMEATMGSSYLGNMSCLKDFSATFEELVKTFNYTIPEFKSVFNELKDDVLMTSLFDGTLTKYKRTCKKLNHELQKFEEDCLMMPIRNMRNDLTVLAEEKKVLSGLIHDIKLVLESHVATMSGVKSDEFQKIKDVMILAKGFIINEKQKHEISQYFTENGLEGAVSQIEAAFNSIQDDFKHLENELENMKDSMQKIWKLILNNESTKKIHSLKKTSTLMTDLERKEKELTILMSEAKRNFTRHRVIAEKFNFPAFYKTRDSLAKFDDETKLSKGFFTENFLTLLVFYKEMSYEVIKKDRAYTFFAFLCDVGGTLGLFIGGSLLTFFEVVDLCAVNKCGKSEEGEDQRQIVNNSDSSTYGSTKGRGANSSPEGAASPPYGVPTPPYDAASPPRRATPPPSPRLVAPSLRYAGGVPVVVVAGNEAFGVGGALNDGFADTDIASPRSSSGARFADAALKASAMTSGRPKKAPLFRRPSLAGLKLINGLRNGGENRDYGAATNGGFARVNAGAEREFPSYLPYYHDDVRENTDV